MPTDVKLAPLRLQLAEYARQLWTVTLEAGTDPAVLDQPAFWSLVAARFSPYDKIEVRADDGSYYAEYIILGCDRTWAKLQMLFKAQEPSTDVVTIAAAMQQAPAPDYLVKWRGPLKKWSVIRVADQMMVCEGQQTRIMAENWLANHRKVAA